MTSHELTERLAWRPSQRHELKLHAACSLIYAVMFCVLGFLGARIVPAKALMSGFVFRRPTLPVALAAILGTCAPERPDHVPEGRSALRHAGL